MVKDSTHSVEPEGKPQATPQERRKSSGENGNDVPTARQRDSVRPKRRSAGTSKAAVVAGKYRRFKSIDSARPYGNDDGRSARGFRSVRGPRTARTKQSDDAKTAHQLTKSSLDKTQNNEMTSRSPPTAAAPDSVANTAVQVVATKTKTMESPSSKENAKKKKDRKKASKKSKKAKKKKKSKGKPKVDEKEHFDNENPEFDYESPDSKSPTISEGRIHECIHDVQLSGSHYTWDNGFQRLAVLFGCTFGYLSYFRFPYLMYKYGGIFFLIPYGVCLCFIGIPLTTLELAIGQYTSLPTTTLFARLAPCYSGVGYTMMLVKVVSTWFIFDPRIMYDWLSSIILMIINLERAWTCEGTFSRDCYKPFLDCGDLYPHHDKCYDVEEDLSREAITFEQAMVIMSGGSAALRRNQIQVFTGKEWFQFFGVYSLSSAFFTIILVLIIFVNGPRYFSITALATSCFSVISAVFLAIFLMVQKGGETWGILWPGDYTKLYDWHTWKFAALGVIFSLSLGDGTMIQIASMSKFNNNIIKDVMFIVCSDIVMNLLTTCITLPLMLQFKDLLYPRILEANFSIKEILGFFGDDWPQTLHDNFIPLFSNFTYGPYIMFLITTNLYFVNIGTLVITAEIFLSTLYHSFPVLLSLDQRYFRHFFGVVFMLAFLLFMMVTTNKLYAIGVKTLIVTFVIEPITPLVALIEVLAIMHHYKFRRFMINMRSMIGLDPNNCVWNFSFIQYVIVLPFLLFATFVVSLCNKQWKIFRTEVVIAGYGLTILTSSLILWGVTISVLWSKHKGRNLRMMFEPHKNWGPQLSDDRNRSEFDERAARVRQ
uniref:Transporter n=1 Tax=Panagrellus redivivus TaxID=6233 RepID=A0A7E4W7V6_PANRE